eukprot:m.30767 g.30767  ORF g.30767 m.30767 type:complete len:432 (+) comp4744_c0_seq1:187-1482(+)
MIRTRGDLPTDMANTKKVERFNKHIGKHVDVADYGLGVLKYFVAEAGICGVELLEPNGDCDGCDAEGTRFFEAKASHGLFIEMVDVTLTDADGQPLKKTTTKKQTTKKKFESPPSLRKKINRSSKSTAPKAPSSPAQAPSSSSQKPAKSPRSGGAHSKTNGHRKATGGADRSKNHLAPKKSGVDPDVQHMQAHRSVTRRAREPSNERTIEAATARAAAEAEDAEGGGDGAATTSVLDVPEDWVEAAKRRQAEAEEQKRIEKEAADLAEQERRFAEAEKRREEEERIFNEQAAAEAAKRDAAKAERKATRDAQAAARAAEREELHQRAAAEIAEYSKVVEKEKTDRDAKANELKAKREAQKARIAAMMQKVKKRTPASSVASSAPESPDGSGINHANTHQTTASTLRGVHSALSPVNGAHEDEDLPADPPTE